MKDLKKKDAALRNKTVDFEEETVNESRKRFIMWKDAL
jgi:hypothetical protein